ncbi:hypothetical protein [Roseateles sp.]|uniref:hypothetical protein n=1 Tax=Roseateles sp. TaxID=1971397 RepID=UPI0026015346|nr:hypothetical protein [Roseateles sp.]MBV8034352.1 hypothetical protein [Roseateles sp.]
MKAAVALAAALVGAVPARAAIDCWMDAPHPQTADRLPSMHASVAPLQQALQRLNAQLHRQTALQALPSSRLRSSWQIAGQWALPARGAHFLLRDHRESMWLGRCDVVKGADRLPPRASIVVQVNQPEAFFATAVPELRDEQFSAWREVFPTAQVQGRPLYGGHMLVITADGRLPWVPVTTADYLDFTERDLMRRHVEARAALASQQVAMAPAAREADIQRVVEGMRRVDPAQALRLEQELRASLAAEARAIESAAARRGSRGLDDDPIGRQLDKLRAYRKRLGAAALAAQARLGLNGLRDDAHPAERYPALVRPDPDYPWDRLHPSRPQMLMVSVRGTGEFELPMAEVLGQLDIVALEALVRQQP